MDNEVDIQKLLEENQKLKEQLDKSNKKIKIKEKKPKKIKQKKEPKKISKKLIIIFLSIVAVLIIGIVSFFFLTNIKFNIDEFKKNIVLILAYDEYGELTSTGSGVYIDSKTIYTNAHVVQGASMLEIVLDNNMKVELKGIQTINEKKDIAILITEKVDDVKKLKMKNEVKVGTEVYAVGSPLGIKNTVSDGVISGEYNDKEMDEIVYQHTAPISPGSSGGALINKKGELIGINYATYTDGQNLNLAIMVDDFNKEYEKTKNDKLIEIETSNFFEIDDLMNKPGKEIIKEVCSIDTSCHAFIDSGSYYENTDEFKVLKKDLEHVVRVESLMYYDETYDGNDWLRVYLFKMKKRNEENDSVFKKLVEYKALETRDNYYNLDFNHYWAVNENYYYYVEYSKDINIEKIVNNLSSLTGGTYE